jgi:hypothetical protein
MTRRDFGKPAFSLRKKRFVKTHALSLLGTTRLLSRSVGWDADIAVIRRLVVFFRHFQEDQVSQLFQVIAITYAVIA